MIIIDNDQTSILDVVQEAIPEPQDSVENSLIKILKLFLKNKLNNLKNKYN